MNSAKKDVEKIWNKEYMILTFLKFHFIFNTIYIEKNKEKFVLGESAYLYLSE